MKKSLIIAISIVSFFCIVIGLLIWNGTFFIINRAEFPDYPETMPFYRKTGEIDISIISGDGINKKISDGFPNEGAAETLVREYLMKNYIFPDDAVYGGSQMTYSYKITDNVPVEKIPEWFSVTFGREFEGIPVCGSGNEININIGDDGTIRLGFILWDNYTLAGQATIISPELAYEKLLAHEDLVNVPMSFPNIAVDEITLCYYYIDIDCPLPIDDYTLMPIWRFKGVGESYYVKGFSSYEYNFEKK
jgi:hypothetical protein